MDARTVREAMADGLETGGVSYLTHQGRRNAFVAGERDFTIAELAMDSLARMELCIAVELCTGVSMLPEEIERHASLGAIADEIGRRLRA